MPKGTILKTYRKLENCCSRALEHKNTRKSDSLDTNCEEVSFSQYCRLAAVLLFAVNMYSYNKLTNSHILFFTSLIHIFLTQNSLFDERKKDFSVPLKIKRGFQFTTPSPSPDLWTCGWDIIVCVHRGLFSHERKLKESYSEILPPFYTWTGSVNDQISLQAITDNHYKPWHCEGLTSVFILIYTGINTDLIHSLSFENSLIHIYFLDILGLKNMGWL